MLSRAGRMSNLTVILLYLVGLGSLQEDDELNTIAEEFWQWKLRQFPEFATNEGMHQYDDTLESFALQTFETRKVRCQEWLNRAKKINVTSLSRENHVTLEMLQDQLGTYVNGYAWKDYGNLNPVSFLEGLHIATSWVSSAQYKTQQDYEMYIRRLELLPQQISEIQTLMERAIELGHTYHRVSVEKVPAQLSDIINVRPNDTVFYTPYLDSTLGQLKVPHRTRTHIRRRGREVIKNVVQPAFRRLSKFITERYLPNTRPEVGVGSLHRGREYYQAALKWHLSLDIDAQKVHDIGQREVSRIRQEMIKVIRHLNFNGDLKDFFTKLNNSEEFYSHSEAELLQGYSHIVHERITPQLGPLFPQSNLSSIPSVKVAKMPKDGISAQYYQGTLWANTRRPKTRPTFNMMALALHEATPGHHLQVSLIKMIQLPNFRRNIWGGRKSSAPFHFPYYTANVEGWGLYAEYLGEEMNMYEDPYERFGRYCFEMFRACRLVIDTGIHAFGWNRQESIDYMLNHTLMGRQEVEIEIDRYITWPGQACAYKIGELRIKELRRQAKLKLGDDFDIKEFHWEILRLGFVPIRVLEQSIHNWIETSAATRNPSSPMLFLTMPLFALMTKSVMFRYNE